ncbi:MAG: hypothetical protein V1867_02845 [Candidatus Falkowbacteria bacterium]
MFEELQEAYENIMHAVCAEEVFGPIKGRNAEKRLAALEEVFLAIAKTVNPGDYLGDLDAREMAQEALKQLNKFRDRAREKIGAGIYGQKIREDKGLFIIRTDKRGYYVNTAEPWSEGDKCAVYRGRCVGGEEDAGDVAVKIADNPADNDFLRNEARILEILKKNPSPQSVHFPLILDHFETEDGRLGVITRLVRNSYNVYEIREYGDYREGVPAKHAVWMMGRMLGAIGRAHHCGIMHNNIEPQHEQVRHRAHNVILLDWAYASYKPRDTGEGFRAVNEIYSAPEVAAKGLPTFATDLYSIGKSMIYILGGDPKTNLMPDTVDERLRNFILSFVVESQLGRQQDAWRAHFELISLVESLWGPRKFMEFYMPDREEDFLAFNPKEKV